MTSKIEEKAYYFLASAVPAFGKCVLYAFTIPSSIRKAVTKVPPRIHVKNLEKEIDEFDQDQSLKKYVNIGDKLGYFGGLGALVFYMDKSREDPSLIALFFAANLASLGWETGRKIFGDKK